MMMKLTHKKVTVNEEKGIVNISFRMTKEFYRTIRTLDLVQDLGLAILSEVEKELKENIPTDSPDLKEVEVTEKYDDEN